MNMNNQEKGKTWTGVSEKARRSIRALRRIVPLAHVCTSERARVTTAARWTLPKLSERVASPVSGVRQVPQCLVPLPIHHPPHLALPNWNFPIALADGHTHNARRNHTGIGTMCHKTIATGTTICLCRWSIGALNSHTTQTRSAR